MPNPSRSFALLVVLAVALVGCGNPPSPSPSPSPTPTPTAPATTPGAGSVAAAQAAAAVLSADPRFVGFTPYNPALTGQSRWYEMTANGSTWDVSVTVGWGGCEAGCAHQHAWHYRVGGDGKAKLVDESGEGLPTDVFPSPGSGIARYSLVSDLPGAVFKLERYGANGAVFQFPVGSDGKARGSLPGGVYILSVFMRPDAGPLPAPFALSLAPDADNTIPVSLAPKATAAP